MTDIWNDGGDRADGARLCARCVGEPFLKALLRKEGAVGLCSYCNAAKGPALPIGRVADLVEQAFRTISSRHRPTRTATRRWPSATATRFERHGLPATEAIADAARIEVEPAEEVRKILAERNYELYLAQMGEESPRQL